MSDVAMETKTVLKPITLSWRYQPANTLYLPITIIIIPESLWIFLMNFSELGIVFLEVSL